ncbi:MAG: Inner membrane transport permease YbhR [Promethearchaeota archaeon]|nr:MAG: Inner membrane transport permease YbhR [Candidatus Lokiarchaeota archaeon]
MKMRKLFALTLMELKKMIREPAYLFLMLLFPAALTLTFGLGFSEIESAIPGKNQFELMVPGLYAYACIFIIMTVAQTFTDDRETGLLKRINLTPTTSSEFMGSHLVSNTILSMLQVAIVALTSFLIGYRSEAHLIGISLSFVFIAILSICSVGLGLITATISKNSGTATGLAFIFILPQMFFGTFIPITSTTQIIAMVLPSYYVTESITKILSGTVLTDISIWSNLAIVSIFSIIIVIAGILIFKKYGKT